MRLPPKSQDSAYSDECLLVMRIALYVLCICIYTYIYVDTWVGVLSDL